MIDTLLAKLLARSATVAHVFWMFLTVTLSLYLKNSIATTFLSRPNVGTESPKESVASLILLLTLVYSFSVFVKIIWNKHCFDE